MKFVLFSLNKKNKTDNFIHNNQVLFIFLFNGINNEPAIILMNTKEISLFSLPYQYIYHYHSY